MFARVSLRSLALAFGLALPVAGCPGGGVMDAGADARPDADPGPVVCGALGCGADEAPLRHSDGSRACVRVGADTTARGEEFPDVAGAAAPVVYVRPGAIAGDGSLARPFGGLAEALAARSDARTVALARGEHRLGSTARLDRAVALLGAGAGAGGTALVGPADGTALEVAGAGADVRIARLAVRYERAPAAGAGVEVSAGGRALLSDVVVERAREGLLAVDARVEASGLTVRGASLRGVALRRGALGAGSDARLTSVQVLDGAQYGLVVEGSRLELRRALVARNGRDGVAVLGAATAGRSVVADVASLCNGVTGVRVEGTGAALDGAQLTVAFTVAPPGLVGGDGVWVGAGASLALDREPPGGGAWRDDLQGRGSTIADNARTGVLASGRTREGVLVGSAVLVRGAAIRANRGPGMFLQERAVAEEVGYSTIDANAALGVGITSGASLRAFICNGVRSTRVAALRTSEGAFELGDGLSVADSADSGRIEGNVLEMNGRFGAVFAGARVASFSGNRGANTFAFGVDGVTTFGAMAGNALTSTSTEPAPRPVAARGAVEPAMR